MTAAVLGLLLALAGWLIGWRTSTQFSNAYFIGGVLAAMIGPLSVMGGFSQRGDFKFQYTRTASNASLGDRTRQMMSEIAEGYNFTIFMVGVGALLIVTAVLIPILFG